MPIKLENIKLQFSRLIFPHEDVAGLEIKDAALRIAKISGGKLIKEGVSLEPGIIEDGGIKDRARLISQLKELKNQFAPEEKNKIPVIAIIPSSVVYVKVFSLPLLSEESRAEAIRLNLQSISPIDFKLSYSDWEQLNEQRKEGEAEILSAFARREAVDSYVDALEASGFSPVAIEFPALAIARAIKQYGIGLDLDKPQVVVNVSSDGIDFMVLKSGNIYFDYFSPWKLMKLEDRASREIPFEDFKNTIAREIKKVATFYASHWGGSLNNLILITQALEKEITEFISTQFNYKVATLALREFSDAPMSWIGVIGSAYRGTIPRSRDIFISLDAVGTENGYLYSQIKFFVKLWRNILLTTAVFFLFIFIAADSFLAQKLNSISGQISQITAMPGGDEVAKLQQEAAVFNGFVEKTSYAKEQSRSWSDFTARLNALSKNVKLVRVSLNPDQKTGFVIGRTSSEAAAIDFKDKLSGEGLQNVNLPLSKIETSANGDVIFSITFSL